MKVEVLGCSGGSAPGAHPSCYLLAGGVAIDAGALAAALALDRQGEVTDVFLTHAHFDHVRDLPLTLINRPGDAPPLRLHGLSESLETVRKHLFNGDIWFEAFHRPEGALPLITVSALEPRDVREVAGYRITAFEVPHTVPSVSYHVDDGDTSVILSGDTAGGGIFRAGVPVGSPLRAVFLEASFPNESADFARLTGHMTPALLAREIEDLPPGVDVYVTHMKPGHEDRITAQIAALGRPHVRVCPQGEVLDIG